MRGTGIVLGSELRLEKKLLEFISENDDCEVDVYITVLRKPEHFLYKYLWGYLYRDMQDFQQESRDDINTEMKEEFAKVYVDEWEDIPKHHRKTCQRFERYLQVGVERWYIKSGSAMGHTELKDFVEKVEQHFFGFLAGNRVRDTKEAYEMRRKGLMDKDELKKYLKENR